MAVGRVEGYWCKRTEYFAWGLSDMLMDYFWYISCPNMAALQEIPEGVYVEHFDAILDWYRRNGHIDWRYYMAEVLSLGETYWRLVDIRTLRNRLNYRVLLKATYSQVWGDWVPGLNIQEIGWLRATITERESIVQPGLSVCWVQLDGGNVPLAGALFPYLEGKFFRIDMGG
jgi:hypothetical protein